MTTENHRRAARNRAVPGLASKGTRRMLLNVSGSRMGPNGEGVPLAAAARNLRIPTSVLGLLPAGHPPLYCRGLPCRRAPVGSGYADRRFSTGTIISVHTITACHGPRIPSAGSSVYISLFVRLSRFCSFFVQRMICTSTTIPLEWGFYQSPSGTEPG